MLRRSLSILCFGTMTVGLPACVSTDNTENEIASLDSQPDIPKAIGSVKDWDALDKDARLAVLEREHGRFPNLKLTERYSPEALSDPHLKAFAEKMAAYMRTNGNMTVEDQSHAKIGETKVYARVLLLDGKTILGGSVQFVQLGCDMPDESVPTFKSKAEADGANCESAADTTWTAYGTFNHDGVPIESGDFMEWGSL